MWSDCLMWDIKNGLNEQLVMEEKILKREYDAKKIASNWWAKAPARQLNRKLNDFSRDKHSRISISVNGFLVGWIVAALKSKL